MHVDTHKHTHRLILYLEEAKFENLKGKFSDSRVLVWFLLEQSAVLHPARVSHGDREGLRNGRSTVTAQTDFPSYEKGGCQTVEMRDF